MDVKKIFAVAVILVIVVLVVVYNFDAIPFKDEFLSNIGNLLALLFFASLLLERALDVLLTITRAPHSEQLDEVIADFRYLLQQKDIPPEEKQKTLESLRTKRDEKRDWRNGTRNISMWLGLILGVVIAAVGIRTLGSIIDMSAIPNKAQHDAFAVVDVLLTGGLLAGGSDGIHKIAELYRNFFESRSAQERNRTLEQKTPKEGATG